MVEMAVFDDAQVPPEEGVTFAVDPMQTAEAPPRAGAEGIGFTDTPTEAGETQLFVLVTVKV